MAARVQIRVGLNSGEVVVRSIGSDLRMEKVLARSLDDRHRLGQIATLMVIQWKVVACSQRSKIFWSWGQQTAGTNEVFTGVT